MKNTTLLVTIPLLFAPLAAQAATIDFEELDVSAHPVSDGSFVSQDVKFVLNYNATYASWDGIALANAGYKYSATSDFTNQFYLADSAANTAHPSAPNSYAVVYDPGAWGSSPEIDLPGDLSSPKSMEVTNTTYTWATIKNGDSYGMSTPFKTGDWYKLSATGYDAEGAATGSVTFYLADYRNNVESTHYILSQFTKVDLTPLGDNVKTVKFKMDSSDTGAYGLNTPAYFALDNFVATGTRLWENNGANQSSWYGDVYTYQKGDGWIYSYVNKDFQYATGTESDAWFYDSEIGWYWTAEGFYPYIYISGLNSWAYFYENQAPASSGERAYYLANNLYSGRLSTYPHATATQIAGLMK